MAVTLEGTFILIDRASRPLRDIERQAQRTDKALRGVGDTMDTIGDRDTQRNLSQTTSQMKEFDRTTTTTNRDTDRLRKTFQGASRDTGIFNNKVVKLGVVLAALGKIITAMKIPALIALVGVAGQAIGDLTAGVIALLPKIADLSGVIGAMGAPVIGMIGTFAAFKLALGDVGEAMKADREEFAKFSPEVQKFATRLKGLQGVIKNIKASAQEGLFPGLNDAIDSLTTKRAKSFANEQARKFGQQGGASAAMLANSFTTPKMLSDLSKLASQGRAIMERLTVSLINVGYALVDMFIAARPFTRWLTETIEGWTQWAQKSSQARRENGEWAKFFARTRNSLELFGSIIENLWGWFRGLGHAGRAAGNELWHAFDRATASWDKWANSVEGERWLKDWFADMVPNVKALGDLVGALVVNIAKMSGSPALKETADTLTKFVPTLRRMLEGAADAWGPALARALGQVIRLFKQLPWSPLAKVLDLATNILRVFNDLLKTIPMLGEAIAAVLVVSTVRKFTAALGGLAAGWLGVSRAAGAATVAQQGAMTGVVGGAGRTAPRLYPIATPGGGMTTTARPPVTGAPVGRMPTGPVNSIGAPTTLQGMGINLGAGALAGGIGAKLGTGAVAGAQAAGKFLWPIMAIMAGINFATTEGGPIRKTQGALSGATFGAYRAPLTEAETRTEAGAQLAGYFGKQATPREIRSELEKQQALVDSMGGIGGTAKGFVHGLTGGRVGPDMEVAQKKLEILKRQEEALKGQRQQQERLEAAQRREKGIMEANTWLSEMDKAFNVSAKLQGPEKALDYIAKKTQEKMRGIGRDGKQQVAQNTLDWAKQQAQSNPALMDEYKDLRREVLAQFKGQEKGIEIVNGRILTGSKKEWKGISHAITSNVEEARQEASAAFTRLQQEAIGSLRAMGYSATEASTIVRAQEKGTTGTASERYQMDIGSGRGGNKTNAYGGRLAGGGRIGGMGLADTVSVGAGNLAAPGELIVNRHTEDRVNQKLAGRTTLGQEVNREGRPHYAPMKKPSWMSRHAKGGGVEQPPGDPGSEVVQAGYGRAVGAFLQRFNMNLTQGYGGASSPSVSPGHTTLGVPPSLDVVPLDGDWDGAFAQGLKWALNQGMQVGYDGQYGTQAWSNHGEGNHAHIDWGGGPTGKLRGVGRAGVALAQAIHLKGQKTKLRGVPGAMSQRSMDIQRAGLEKMVNRKIGAGAAAGPVGNATVKGKATWFTGGTMASGLNTDTDPGIALNPNPGGPDPSSWNNKQTQGWLNAKQPFMVTVGDKRAVLPVLDMGPAGWTGNAIDVNLAGVKKLGYTTANFPSGTMATAQIMGGGGGGRKVMGGRIPWFGGGADFIADRPQLIGVGDGGSERVQVTPAGSRGNGTIQIGKLEIHAKDHKEVRQEVEKALINVARQIDRQPMNDTSELM